MTTSLICIIALRYRLAGHAHNLSHNNMASLFRVMVILYLLNTALSAKIAGLSSMASGSHYFVTRSTMEELASRGHEVSLALVVLA